MMKIYIVGNPLVERDNLPHKLAPVLREEFPDVQLVEADPNENFIPEDGSVILDTIEGLSGVRRFDDLDAFEAKRSVSPHDYDLGFHLQLLKKMHTLPHVIILGVPQKPLTDVLKQQVISAVRQIVKHI